MVCRRSLLWALALCALAATSRAAWPHVTPGSVVLRNSRGMEAHILRQGACVHRLVVPDKNGKLADVMLGFDDPGYYKNDTSVAGCILGRVGNRIVGAQFTLDGVTYQLDKNSGKKDTQHGGFHGYHTMQWEVKASCLYGNHSWVMLKHFSPDGEQGFPGNLTTYVIYTLTSANELIIDIQATTDKATPVNVMNHPYMNLKGYDQGDILGHEFTLNAAYLANSTGGLITPVAGTPYDFRLPKTFAASGVQSAFHAVLFGVGPEAKQVIKGFIGAEPAKWAATLYDPKSGRAVDFITTAPSMVVNSAYKPSFAGKGGYQYLPYAAVAVEAVMFPDAINQPNYPSNVLRPGQEYHNQVTWRFSNGRPALPSKRKVAVVKNPTCVTATKPGQCGTAPATPSSQAYYLTSGGSCKPCPAGSTWCTNVSGTPKECRTGYVLKAQSGRMACVKLTRRAA